MSLAIVAGVAGGATIAVLAGARRTETAYSRFLRTTNAFDVLVTNGGTTAENTNRQFDFDAVARLPAVADAAPANYYFPSGSTPAGRPVTPGDLTPLAPADGRFGTELNRARVLDGRLPRGQLEVAITFLAADSLGLDVGDTVRLGLSGPQAMATDPGSGPGAPGVTPAGAEGPSFRVVGVVAMEGGFPPVTGGVPPLALLSGSYARAHPDAIQVLAVRLRRGMAGIAAFERELDRLAGGEQVVATDALELTSAVQRSLDVQATSLRILAVLAAAVALLLLGQALARETTVDARDHAAMRALGATGSQLHAFGVVRTVMIAVAAAWVAVVAAVALSPLAPVGVARRAEPRPGVEVNAAYVGGGALCLLIVVVALGSLSSWRSVRSGAAPRRRGGMRAPSLFASTLARAGFSAPAVSGARMALEQGHGRSAVPVRSTVVSVVLGVATIAAALSFSTSLGHLFGDPRLYGWNWDVQVGDAFSPDLTGEAQRLRRDPAAQAISVGTISRLQIGRLRVDTLATDPVKGAIEPTVVEGRAPRRPTEVLLGSRTLRDLGVHLGDVVTVGFGDRTAPMRVVGRGVLTEFAGGARLGEGAAVTLDGIRRVVPDAVPDVVLLRLRGGPAGAKLLDGLAEARPGNIYLPVKPSDLADLERVGGLPSVVAGLLAVMAVATMTHTLTTSVRQRRRDLAILKMLGFVRGQVAATVAWQASVVAGLAVVLGLPLGVAAGRWSWQLFADRLGVPPQPALPALAVVLLVPATLLLANVIAVVPGRAAARTRSTVVLRAEGA